MVVFDCVVILSLLATFSFAIYSFRKLSREHAAELLAQHEQALTVLATIAESAMQNVKATSLLEREQVRSHRAANDVQLEQMRDIIKKQASQLEDRIASTNKVRLVDGTEINPDEYEFGIAL